MLNEAIRKEAQEKIRIEKAKLQMENSIRAYSALVDGKSVDRIKINDLYVEVDDHLEIKKEYIKLLKFIDLSGETFKNVKISGIDFRDTNINLNPQLVYKKDLSNCNFNGLYLSPFIDFTGVNIMSTRFSYDDNNATIDVFNSTFPNSIYDEKTMFNDKPMIEFMEKEKTR